MKTALAGLVLVLAAAACRSSEVPQPGPGILRGRVEGGAAPDGATVQIYRLGHDGRPEPDPFETAAPDAKGAWTTKPLSPGRYRVVLRAPDRPPAATTVRVPTPELAILRRVDGFGLVEHAFRAAPGCGPLRCRLTEVRPHHETPDVRTFTCGPDRALVVRGLRPGPWRLDLPELGLTTEVVVVPGAGLPELTVDPPEPAPGGSLTGEVRSLDGSGAAWLAVVARPLPDPEGPGARWGRYGLTDRRGRYRIVGIPPGAALVRVECREVPVRILPAPHVVPIPPSGTLELGFVVEP